MAIIQSTTHSSDVFIIDAASKRIVAEASTITAHGTRLFGQVYDDACDEGFSIVSSRTGRVVTWAVHHEERDADGDILWWVLKPARAEANLQGWQTIVYND